MDDDEIGDEALGRVAATTDRNEGDDDLAEDREHGRLDGRRDLTDERRPGGHARLPMQRIGELIPAAARHLGLEEELRTARARTTWDAIVGERVPAATGESRLVGIDGSDLLVEADTPIVGQELRMRSADLLAAFRGSPGGFQAAALRVRVRHG
jgi:hypothetical protein